ncbi:L-2-hydroxyglutarate oxidase [Phycicoccus sp. Soil748]|uniref:L-2-hydroxyglutarate oxidase n=1 Tax=Phycicoccus sp. Soil748 TaxID=1736397 RepID=UPI00070299A1|nr:L-2-hydroxyglutarate oxidase [Phycicoccus sp. Soil748]KRE55473.1 hydroxyglutarate oxidase [Phycicoccus sp. Soil748]
MGERRIAVVGGGIVGLAVAMQLSQRDEGVRVVVMEKEPRLAAHQTGHNSGVVHAGIYYRPGSLKARLCTRGRGLLRDFCDEHRLPFVECGKLVVAVDSSELSRFEALERSAHDNGVPGLRVLGPAGIAEVEPSARGLAALHSPRTAITDYGAVARAMAVQVVRSGGAVHLATEVTEITRAVGGLHVSTAAGVEVFDQVVVCAGLQADRVSRRVDHSDDPRIIPFRGDYLTVRAEKADLVNGLIYPVPDPRYPFLGVHFTRRVGGQLDVGPNAVLSLHREGYGRTAFRLADVGETVAWPGFWHLARRHWVTGAKELHASASRRSFMRVAQRYVPDISHTDVVRGPSGVRAQSVSRDGSLVDDFTITEQDGVTCVRNAPSPAATSCLAIAEHVVDLMQAPR